MVVDSGMEILSASPFHKYINIRLTADWLLNQSDRDPKISYIFSCKMSTFIIWCN